jgi:uncharacterized protein YuzE
MRILDEKNSKSLDNLYLLLTEDEAKEMIGKLNDSLLDIGEMGHFHVADIEYKHQITCAIYSNNSINTFSTRVQQLINNNT